MHMLDATEDGIELFAVDCFNDVTGMDNPCFVLHDAQSKAEKNISPAKLGRYLVTLLENHLSEFSQFFDSLTLFVGGVSKTVLQNPELVEFGFHDIEAKAGVRTVTWTAAYAASPNRLLRLSIVS